MTVYSRRKFPVEESVYRRVIGKLLPHRVSQILNELGYETEIQSLQANGVDLKAFNSEGELILVAEILNWSSYSRLSSRRRRDIIENLQEYNCRKVLIYTACANETVLDDLPSKDISLLRIGYQIQPREFYVFFDSKNQVESRRPDSREVKEDIKSRVINYMEYINIGIVCFVGNELTIERLY